MADAASLIDAVAALVAALAWPVLLVLVLLYVKRSLDEDRAHDREARLTGTTGPRNVVQRFVAWFGEGDKTSAQAGPFGFSREKTHEAAEASARLTLLERERAEPMGDEESFVKRIADTVVGGIQASTKARGLWVDDKPSGNRRERAALKPSVDFALARSTDDAIEILTENGTYDVVISNWTRPGDDGALALLDKMAALEHRPPVVIYAGRQDDTRVRDAMGQGAFGYTTRPSELYELVTRAIEARGRA